MTADDRFVAGRRRALILANGQFRHGDLQNLESPPQDAEIAKRVLSDPDLGRFTDVQAHHDLDVGTARRVIFNFFTKSAKADDFLLFYFSTHGRVHGRSDRLYLCTIDTDPDGLLPTTVPAEYIREAVEESPARQIVVVLDCCHAGGFEGELRQRQNDTRIIILTAGRNELAHEGDRSPGDVRPSAFAGAFFEGLESGEADADDNGWITVREAFEYAKGTLSQQGQPQSPVMRGGFTSDLYLAKAPITADSLPPEIATLVRHRWPMARLLAVDELGRWISAEEQVRRATAEEALDRLRRDSDSRVANAAGQFLAGRRARGELGASPSATAELPAEPHWYRRTIFYELRVRSFYDGNHDGAGDFAGLIERLDYLQWLGVGTLLLTPIYDSPLEDDGYDISDFTSIHRELGTLAEFTDFLAAAHRRGIRVVLDLVLNHTSWRHRWFEASRRDRDGEYGDFYVWRDDDEPSSAAAPPTDEHWSFDRVRGQYYWHRFEACEPDLNFDSPAVQKEMLSALRHWLDLGVDGFRLVTAPYLYERVGTDGEGLAETHDYLHRMRADIDHEYPDKLLLGWADRWPADAAGYFGTAERPECGVVLYTSLMPRIFLGMRQESHYPISEILAETAAIRADCQWGVFLRNADELALETVDDDQRRYLVNAYAPTERMRTPTGIRRRLAPLLDGDRSQLELCMALLLSLPGAPVLYYGDEIGMGENLALAGTAAIRTPMQWSADRGAGFSTAAPDDLATPLVVNPSYAYPVVNVEAQRQPGARSLLKTVQSLIRTRRRSEALTIGDFYAVESGNQAVLAYLRRGPDGEAVLCVANFSQFPQAAVLDLDGYAGRQPIELTGRTKFAPIGTDPYPITPAGHGFLWFDLSLEST